MKKIFTLLFVFSALLIACSKVEMGTDEAEKGTKEFHIRAISEDVLTKTTYELTDGMYNFSWHSDDKIGVQMIKKADSSFDMSKFSNTSVAGPNADFSAAGNASYDLGNYAFYPCRYPSDYNTFTYEGNSIWYSQSQTDLAYLKTGTAVADQAEADAAAKATVRLFGTITEDAANPMRHIPLIGIRKGETTDFSFKAATGVLKLTLKSLPATATQIRLDATGYALNGYFVFDTNGEIKESYKKEGYGQKYMNITTSGDSERAFYFPIPTGTIPAGKLTVSVTDGTNVLYAVTNKQDIELVRGEITELPTIDVPSVKVKITGTPTAPKAKFYFSGDVAYVKYRNTMTLDYAPNTDITTSGTEINLAHDFNYKYPLQYQAYNSSDVAIGGLQILYYYALAETGISEVCKQFTSANSDIGLSDSRVPELTNNPPFSATVPTITFAVSDNILKGNIIVTEFCGVEGKVYGSYVDYQTASGTPVQNPPQIYVDNSVFCNIGGKDYILKENNYSCARFAVKTTKYGTPVVYGVNANLVCWGESVGLYADSWGPFVHWFFDKE